MISSGDHLWIFKDRGKPRDLWRGGRSWDFTDAYRILTCPQTFHSHDYIIYKHQHQSTTNRPLPAQTLCLPNLWWCYLCSLADPRLHLNDTTFKKTPCPLLPYLRETQSVDERKEIFFCCKQENEVFVFRKIQGISWLAEKVLASQ
jgi:hypothetical protein